MTISIEWAEKYRPRSLSEVVGNKKAVMDLQAWAEEWLHGVPEKRAVILQGQAGIGKTSAAHALANDYGWEIIELNASDQRTASVIERVAGSASKMRTLSGTDSKRLIILDEADNIHGTSDRGGARAIGDIIKKTNQPIVLIANDLYGLTSTLRTLCLEIKFHGVQSRSMVPALKNICHNEGIMCGVGVIENVAENAGGDMRSAVNDLQAVSTGRNEINIEDIATSQRDTKGSIFKVLEQIFKGTDAQKALNATYGLDENPEDLVHWIDENLPGQYGGGGAGKVNVKVDGIDVDVSNGFEYLSHADRYLGRVKKRQNYRMWRYAGVLMTCGAVVAKTHVHGGFIKYQPPSFWRRLGQLRARRTMRDNVASKIGEHCHESMRYARADLTSMYGRMLKDEKYAVDTLINLNLNLDELAYMTESPKVTKKLQGVYDQAQSIINEKVSDDIEFFAAPKTDRSNKIKSKNDSQVSLDSIQNIIETTAPADVSNEKDDAKSSVAKKRESRKPQKTLFDF
ncbi:MAG: replication factor C large subunit [Methanosarcinaceae archaeon]|nr:replication factor C large subunit [Methanosarcinaceae archaeon]